MSMFAKIMVVVNFILAVAFLAAAGTLLGAAEDYKSKYEKSMADAAQTKGDLEKQVEARQKLADQNQQKFVETDKLRASNDAQLKVLADSNQQLKDTLAQLRSSYDKVADAQKDLQARLASLNSDLDKVRGDLATSEAGRKESDGKSKSLSEEIARLTQEKEDRKSVV